MKPNFDFNLKPLVIAETALSGDLTEAEVKKNMGTDLPSSGSAKKQVGILSIRGVLYPSTYERIDYMLDLLAQQCSVIILDIDSPGGAAAGVFDLSDKIYFLRQTISIYSIVGEACYSGAYALASASTKIFLARSAGVGSIGVVAVHTDQSGLHDKIGLKFTPIYAGAKKVDGSPLGPLSERAMADLQKSIDNIYSLFCKTVARNRGMFEASVRKTEAGLYYDKDAVEAGLADQVASRREALALIGKSDHQKGAQTSATKPKESMVPSVPAKAKTFDPDLLKKDAIKRAAAAAPAPSKSTKQPIHSMSVSTSYLH